MLCKTSVENKEAREEYGQKAQTQMDSVDNNLMREQDPRMPLLRPGVLQGHRLAKNKDDSMASTAAAFGLKPVNLIGGHCWLDPSNQDCFWLWDQHLQWRCR